MKSDNKHLLFGQEVYTADWLLHVQALLALARLNVPEANRLVVRTTNQALAPEKECGTEVGVAREETDGLRQGVRKVGFTVMEGLVQGEPWKRSQRVA